MHKASASFFAAMGRWAAAASLAWAAAVVQAAPEVVIGQVAPMTGVIAATGDDYTAGAAAAFAAVNAKGGIYGRKIRVVLKDDAYKPDKTVQLTNELLEKDNPVALFGYIGTANILALNKANTLSDQKIALLAPFTGAEELRQPLNPYIFHIRASYSDETAKMVQHLSTLGLRRFAVFYQNDGMGASGLAGAKSALDKLGLKAVAEGTYDRAKPDEVDAALTSILAGRPDAVVMVSTTRATAAFIKKMSGAASKAKLFAISTVNFKELIKITGEETARGVGISQVMPFPYNQFTAVPVVREFHAAMKQYAPTKNVSHTSMEGFIAAKVLIEAIRRSRADPSRERILAQLSAMENYDLGGFKINFGPENRVGAKFVEVAVIGRDGKLVR